MDSCRPESRVDFPLILPCSLEVRLKSAAWGACLSDTLQHKFSVAKSRGSRNKKEKRHTDHHLMGKFTSLAPEWTRVERSGLAVMESVIET